MRLFDDDAPNYESASFPTPRPFQHEAHERLRQGFLAGHRCQMLMSATGSGKTFLGLRVIHEALKKGKRAIFVCDRRSLIEQTSAVADSYGLSAHGVMMANHNRFDPSMPFQIASAQTLARRKWPDADVIVIDEAHTQMKVWTEHIQNTNAAVIGLSATPFSTGLGKLFSNLVNATSMHHLTESGVLVPMRVFPCFKVDMRGAETSGGEWTDRAAQERGMAIVGDVVTEWSKFASDRKTIVFGATIAHCESMARQFNNSGIMAACFTSDTDQAERDMLLAEYRKPDSALRVLISVEALAKGFDVPDVSCVCDVRPLRKSLSTAIQMWGRGLRRSPDTGKTDCVLRDTMILTDKGEVRIQDITLDHKVWDGINFVDHCGIVCRGIRPVISYGGLTATPDHEVMTDDGWERFEDAARRKKRIIVAGIGGSPIRLSEDSLSKNRGKRRESKGRGRLSSMFSLLDDFCQQHLEQAENTSMSKLQWAKSGNGSKVALRALPRMASALFQSAHTLFRTIRGAWNSISVFWSQRSGALGGEYAWYSGQIYATGQDRQQWTLRAGEYSVVSSGREYEQHEGFSRKEGVHRLSEKTSRSYVRGQHTSQTRSNFDGRRDCGAVEDAFIKTEGEVWDILNAGPLQRFTANGLLVHNCLLLDFSGNVIRFADDFSDIFYNGLDELDCGEKLDKAIRRDDEEKPEGKECHHCGYKPCGRRCVSCGFEHHKRAEIVHEAGEMREVLIGKTKYADDKRHLWEQCCTYARGRSVPEKQRGRASNIYRDITGEWPKREWDFESTPNVAITRPVLNKIRQKNIAFAAMQNKLAA